MIFSGRDGRDGIDKMGESMPSMDGDFEKCDLSEGC